MIRMCGISGIFASHITDEHKKIIFSIVQSQYARGPDHQEVKKFQGHRCQVIMGHNRLSIVDLSSSANQPMQDSTSRYSITFNGEIYNYIELRNELINYGVRFATKSDTEVILNAFSVWGIDALSHFLGPFSFGLFDSELDELWLCRDRFGVRPLYYVLINDTVYFASSTSVLANSLQLKPNFSYLAKGLSYLVYEDGSESSPYQHLLALPPSSYLRIRFKSGEKLSSKLHTYYNLRESVEKLSMELPLDDVNQLLIRLSDTLNESVMIRLRADVPLAISLSSGLDSSSIAALVSERYPGTVGFSFGHPQQKKSEGPLVEQCARLLNIPIEYIWPTHHEMIEGLFETITTQEAPFSSLSIVAQYILYKKVRKSGIKVLFGGQGGDECFMGYRKFLLFWLKKMISEKRYFCVCKNAMGMLSMMTAEAKSFGMYWRHRHRYIGTKVSPNTLQFPIPDVAQFSPAKQESLWIRQMYDVTQFSLPTLLRYEDCNAMGNSVESRLPFLDHRLVELGLALPIAMKLRSGYGKWAMREIMRDKIPNAIRLARNKRGFDIPMNQLIKAGLGHAIRDALHQNKHITNQFVTHGIDKTFSDRQLMTSRSAMAQAITMLWLNKVLI